MYGGGVPGLCQDRTVDVRAVVRMNFIIPYYLFMVTLQYFLFSAETKFSVNFFFILKNTCCILNEKSEAVSMFSSPTLQEVTSVFCYSAPAAADRSREFNSIYLYSTKW